MDKGLVIKIRYQSIYLYRYKDRSRDIYCLIDAIQKRLALGGFVPKFPFAKPVQVVSTISLLCIPDRICNSHTCEKVCSVTPSYFPRANNDTDAFRDAVRSTRGACGGSSAETCRRAVHFDQRDALFFGRRRANSIRVGGRETPSQSIRRLK